MNFWPCVAIISNESFWFRKKIKFRHLRAPWDDPAFSWYSRHASIQLPLIYPRSLCVLRLSCSLSSGVSSQSLEHGPENFLVWSIDLKKILRKILQTFNFSFMSEMRASRFSSYCSILASRASLVWAANSLSSSSFLREASSILACLVFHSLIFFASNCYVKKCKISP